jgi:hypothetical protein
MTDTGVTLLYPSPAKAEGRPKIKDPTGPLRSRRARQKRKTITGAKTKPGSVFAIPAKSGISAHFIENNNPNEIKPDGTVAHPRAHAVDVVAYVAAITLAGAAAWFSIWGMVVLFPGSRMSVIGMAVAMGAPSS